MKGKRLISICFLSLFSFGFAPKMAQESTTSQLIADFESQEEVNSTLVYANWGAKRAYSEEVKSHGKGSCYLEFEPGTALPMPNQYPDFYYENQLRFFPLTSSYIPHTTDYSRTESFLIDVYGNCSRSFNVYLNIMTDSGKKIETEPQIALDGQWSTLKFTLDIKKATYLGLASISYFYLSFDNVYEGATPVSMYLDNFRTHDYKTLPDTSLPPLPALKKGTVADFEDDYLYSALWINNPGQPIHTRYFLLSKNEDPKYVSEGKSSLRIEMQPSIQQEANMRNYFEIRFPDEYTKAVDFASFPTEDEKVDDTTVRRYRLAYDVYLDYDYPVFANLNVVDEVGDHLEIAHNLTPNAWTTIASNLNSPYIWGGKAGYKMLDWQHVSSMYFIMREYYGARRAYLYIDNIRIEQVEEKK